MSLRSFHLVFVTVCTLLFAFLTLWAFLIAGDRTAVTQLMGWVGCAGLLLMPFYGWYFLRKANAAGI